MHFRFSGKWRTWARIAKTTTRRTTFTRSWRSDKTGRQIRRRTSKFENVEPCGYCTKVCFCSPGHRIKRPYNLANGKGHAIDASVLPRNDHYQLSDFRDEALKTIARLCEEKLQSHTDSFSGKMIKEKYAVRDGQKNKIKLFCLNR